MRYLLDTNVCIEYLRGRNLALRNRMNAMSASDFCVCSIVLAELYRGAFKSSDSQGNLGLINRFLLDVRSIPFDDVCAALCGELRADLERQGHPIGPYDIQIAAIALVHGLTLVTGNLGEFNRVPGLLVEDWN